MNINTSGDLILSFFGSIEREREREKTLNPACKVENYDIIDREFNLDVDWVEYCVEWEK